MHAYIYVGINSYIKNVKYTTEDKQSEICYIL